MARLRFVDVLDEPAFGRIPPCADPRFDHRSCDYWEDADRGSRDARSAWLTAPAAPPSRAPVADNPFAPPATAADRRGDALAALLGQEDDDPFDPFGGQGESLDDIAPDDPGWNPFAPATARPAGTSAWVPRKLGLLTRGKVVFGSYARVAVADDRPVAYAQFGPLSAYPRAQRLRELYPQLPSAPLPAVITCISTTAEGRGQGYARSLVADVSTELARRGFAAVEVYPDLTQSKDATSAATPGFWEGCGFVLVVPDERYPVLRLELG
jgi:GNAT superfamily N-acetyltransferase